jgi:nucleoside-diphosphate-sugar epimerase
MRILIFGGSGFIGGELSKYLMIRKAEVVIFARSSNVNKNYSEFVKWDFNSKLTLEKIKGADVAIHLAHDNKDLKKTYNGTLACISALKKHGVKNQIFFSSYSANKEALSEYGKLKYKIEKKLTEDITIIRPGLVIGNGGVYQKIKKNLLERLFYPIFITEFKVPVINIEDLVEEIYLIIQNKKKPREVNIFEPNFIRLNELIFEIVKNKKNKIGIYMPITFAVILLQINKNANSGLTLDNFKGLVFNQKKPKESNLKRARPYQENKVINNHYKLKASIIEYAVNGLFFSLLAVLLQFVIDSIFLKSNQNFMYSAVIIYILLTLVNYRIQKFWIFYQEPKFKTIQLFFAVNIISLFFLVYINNFLFIFESRLGSEYIYPNFNFFLSLLLVSPCTFLLQSFWTFPNNTRRKLL